LFFFVEFLGEGGSFGDHAVALLADVFEVGSAASALVGVGELFGGEGFEGLGDLDHVLFVALVLFALGEALRGGGAVL
jgi:hypothetical protein